MSGVNSKGDLPPLLLARSQLNLCSVATRSVSYQLQQVPWLEGPFEEENFDYLSMAQCSRVQRPPPPPHYIAQSRKINGGGASAVDGCGLGLPSDPARRVKQLERSIAFMRESHAVVLRSLHLEVDDLKTKNRDLVFQLVMNNPLQAAGKDESNSEPDLPQEAVKKIEKLEKEVRKLRSALREALKVNGSLNAQLVTIKHSSGTLAAVSDKSQSALDLRMADGVIKDQRGSSSPKMEDYADTLHQIQQLSSSSRTRSCRTVMEGGRSGGGEGSGGEAASHVTSEWTYVAGTGTGGHRERGRRHSDFQPHLPRLPLRASQLNLNSTTANSRTEVVQFPNRDGSDSLPSSKKPMFPLLQGQQGQGHGDKREGHKSRKPRGTQRGRGSTSNGIGQHHHQQR